MEQGGQPDPESLETLGDMLQLLMEIHDEVFIFRLKKIVSENNPYMPPKDIMRLRLQRREGPLSIEKLLENFLQQRQEHEKLLCSLPAGDWQRTGLHASEGHISLEVLVRRLIEYDQDTLYLFEQILQNKLPASSSHQDAAERHP